ncbi:class I SAM-dependent methyltransferase [Candidatus Woesearchaeota archaeon]|nr:class I SAM-dependent methyltransferase [Candidatus Woesearchaeota archaeon]
MDQKVAWEKEYKMKGIPSSYKTEPSREVVYFTEFLKKQKVAGKALDLGSGKGRNSVHLAKHGFTVACMDFLQSNIDFIKKQYNFETYCQDVADKWQFPSNHFDAVIDVFCYKHITDSLARLRYRDNLSRVLKPTGYYLLSLATPDDGYYGELLKQKPNQQNIIVDPKTGISSVLFTETDIKREFNAFTVVEVRQKNKLGMMHGQQYLRKSLFFIIKKN